MVPTKISMLEALTPMMVFTTIIMAPSMMAIGVTTGDFIIVVASTTGASDAVIPRISLDPQLAADFTRCKAL
jgi:hypothetical protein